MTEAFRWMAYGICHIGTVRGKNEDNLLFCGDVREDLDMPVWESAEVNGTSNTLFAVADGMGGEALGAWASWVTAMGLQELKCITVQGIVDKLQEINRKICHKTQECGVRCIGSTAVVACIEHSHVDLVNLGDSRGYLWKNGILSQLTYDHTEWQSKINMGFTVEALQKSKASQSALTQHLGISPDELILEPHIASCAVERGDKLLLCSDGLSGMVSNEAMKGILEKELSPKETVHQLLQLALHGGGRDNITILVVDF